MPQNQFNPEDLFHASTEEAEQMLLDLARKGAQKLIQQALNSEIQNFLTQNSDKRDESGKQQIVRNGHAPVRKILTGVGTVEISRPRLDERKAMAANPDHKQFISTVLPRFLRRTPSVDGVVATLYLKGISTNDFDSVLRAIFGEDAGSLSPTTVSRLKEVWTAEYELWRKERLSASQYAYIWADGVYFKARLEGEKSCVLVVIGAKFSGEKELLGIVDGVRESEISWTDLLLELKGRGMKIDPKLAIGDGALGFWKALKKVFPTTKVQRCWVHKTANILNLLPKQIQPKAKTLIHDIYLADTKENANKAFNHFCSTYEDKYPNAVACLSKDSEVLLNFYDFPAAHWRHIRTTNPIESVFATVRLRTYKTKGMGTRKTTLAMVFKLVKEAEKGWHKINKWIQLELVKEGRVFQDGTLVEESAA